MMVAARSHFSVSLTYSSKSASVTQWPVLVRRQGFGMIEWNDPSKNADRHLTSEKVAGGEDGDSPSWSGLVALADETVLDFSPSPLCAMGDPDW